VPLLGRQGGPLDPLVTQTELVLYHRARKDSIFCAAASASLLTLDRGARFCPGRLNKVERGIDQQHTRRSTRPTNSNYYLRKSRASFDELVDQHADIASAARPAQRR